MNTLEKKQALLQTLASINDESIIDELYEVLHPEKRISEIDKEKLPQELQSKLNKGMKDFNEGNYITNEQMKEKSAQWVTK
jgi:hypothetical protein